MIAEKLIPRLREDFPTVNMTFGVPPAAVIVILAAHPDVGDIEIIDDGNELTIVAGNFTHGHFSDFRSTSSDEAEKNIIDDVVHFLERLFADEIVLWGSRSSQGGWYDRTRAKGTKVSGRTGPLYVWSGPITGE